MVQPLCSLVSVLLFCLSASAVTLPIEVTGADGTTQSTKVELTPAFAHEARSLWMQIHGLEYADMVSVRVNQSRWFSLNNQTVTVAEPGKSYGGIGGGFATLQLTLPLTEGTIVDGSNTIDFRFNRTNGVVSGFRVLAFNFLTSNGRCLLPANSFINEDPNTWLPPLRDGQSIAAGRNLWQQAQLAANGLPNAPPIRAHCSDCHTHDGRDLKYFNFSNDSIVARSRFHGLSNLQGQQIASYIRTLNFPNPGRPWNPPYQPGPGLDAQPVANWAAGAGLEWVLNNDVDTLPFFFNSKGREVFRPDGDLNPREIPIAMQLPDWNHWLPHVHPLDAWGDAFVGSAFAQLYQTVYDDQPATPAFFENWSKARAKFLSHRSPLLTDQVYSAQLWQLAKTWELMQEMKLEETRVWPNTMAAATAPSAANISDGPNGMGGSALSNEFFSSAWYQVQVILNSGNHRHHGRTPLDWIYLTGHFIDLERLSRQPEPARLLVTVIKALQSTDPGLGPENIAEGWRPELNLDPRIMIDPAWAPMFATLAPDVRLKLTESFLTTWLDKTQQYPPVAYFQLGLHASSYARPTDLREVSGGRVWEALPQFAAAGVDPRLLQRLQLWGKHYTAMAELFHY